MVDVNSYLSELYFCQNLIYALEMNISIDDPELHLINIDSAATDNDVVNNVTALNLEFNELVLIQFDLITSQLNYKNLQSLMLENFKFLQYLL